MSNILLDRFTYNTIIHCDCKTNNIIFCISCNICFKQYIGYTNLREHSCNVTQHKNVMLISIDSQ